MTYISWSSDFSSFRFCSESILVLLERPIQASYAVLRQLLLYLLVTRTCTKSPTSSNFGPKWPVPPAKPQISLGIHTVWAKSSLSPWRNIEFLATHWAQSEDSDHLSLGWKHRSFRCFCHVVAQLFSYLFQSFIFFTFISVWNRNKLCYKKIGLQIISNASGSMFTLFLENRKSIP